MTILVIADDEELRANLVKPQVTIDLLVSCGDLPDDLILEIANRSNCWQILAVKGNHDSSGRFSRPIQDLHFNIVEIKGLLFGGCAGAWKYKPKGNFLFEQREVTSMLSSFPAVDVFVAHNSPLKIHDKDDGVHVGFEAFNSYIDRARPRLFLHGHHHISAETILGRTRVVGTYGSRLIDV